MKEHIFLASVVYLLVFEVVSEVCVAFLVGNTAVFYLWLELGLVPLTRLCHCVCFGVSVSLLSLWATCLLFDNALFLSHLLFGLRYSSTRLAGCWVVLRSSCWDGDLWENSYWLIYLPFRILYSPYGGLGLIPAEESGPLPTPCCAVCLPQVN